MVTAWRRETDSAKPGSTEFVRWRRLWPSDQFGAKPDRQGPCLRCAVTQGHSFWGARSIPGGAAGRWRQIRFLRPPNTWWPWLVCDRLILFLPHHPRPRRLQLQCGAGLPDRGGAPDGAARCGRAGFHPESAATWVRENKQPAPLRSATGLPINCLRTAACAFVISTPR